MKKIIISMAIFVLCLVGVANALPTVTAHTFKRITPASISVKDSCSFTYLGQNFMICDRIQYGGMVILKEDSSGMYQPTSYIHSFPNFSWNSWAPHVFFVGSQPWIIYCDTQNQPYHTEQLFLRQHLMMAKLVMDSNGIINTTVMLSTVRPVYGIGIGDDISGHKGDSSLPPDYNAYVAPQLPDFPYYEDPDNAWGVIDPCLVHIGNKWHLFFTRVNDPYNHIGFYSWCNWYENLPYVANQVPQWYYTNQVILPDPEPIGWYTWALDNGQVQEAPFYKDGYLYYSVGFSNGDHNPAEGGNGISHLRRAMVHFDGNGNVTGTTFDSAWGGVKAKTTNGVECEITTHPDYGASHLRATIREQADPNCSNTGYWIGEMIN